VIPAGEKVPSCPNCVGHPGRGVLPPAAQLHTRLNHSERKGFWPCSARAPAFQRWKRRLWKVPKLWICQKWPQQRSRERLSPESKHKLATWTQVCLLKGKAHWFVCLPLSCMHGVAGQRWRQTFRRASVLEGDKSTSISVSKLTDALALDKYSPWCSSAPTERASIPPSTSCLSLTIPLVFVPLRCRGGVIPPIPLIDRRRTGRRSQERWGKISAAG
jgi:hypothetical protein